MQSAGVGGWDERLEVPEGIEILGKGQFQLRWYQGSRAVYKGVGDDLQEAITARGNQIALRRSMRLLRRDERLFLVAPPASRSPRQSSALFRRSAWSAAMRKQSVPMKLSYQSS